MHKQYQLLCSPLQYHELLHKNNKEVDANFCDNQPVSKHYAIGKKLGVTGTPAIFSTDGSLIPGYLSPEDLLTKLKS